ncbi:PRR5L protein, partial [Polyodon spathula]|nr:PRR5L protein [Polyodon spathula]
MLSEQVCLEEALEGGQGLSSPDIRGQVVPPLRGEGEGAGSGSGGADDSLGIHDPSGPCEQYCQLERLVECVVSPYLGSCLDRRGASCLLEGRMSKSHQKVVGLMHYGPEIVITQHAPDSLAPLVELEGEAYLEKLGGVRRHTIANAHSNLQFLAVASMMHSGMVEEDSLTNRHCQGAPHH